MDSPGSLDAFLSERQARHTGFMLLVHKFPINGARISPAPIRVLLVHPLYRLLRDFPRSFLRLYRLPFFRPSPRFRRSSGCVSPSRRRGRGPRLGLPLIEIVRLFTRVSRRVASVTREEIFEFIDRRYLPPILFLLRRPISSDVLEKKTAAWHSRSLIS